VILVDPLYMGENLVAYTADQVTRVLQHPENGNRVTLICKSLDARVPVRLVLDIAGKVTEEDVEITDERLTTQGLLRLLNEGA